MLRPDKKRLPTCEECRKLQKEDPHYHRSCETCPRRDVTEFYTLQAKEIISLYNMASSQLRVGGLGTIFGVDLNAVRFLLELWEIPQYKWRYYALWIVWLVNEIIIAPENERAKRERDKLDEG